MPDEAPNQPENAPEDGRPDWLPDNFNSPEDLAASYKEAQRKITEVTQASSQLEQNYATLAGQMEELQAQQGQQQFDPQQAQSQLYDAWENDPVGTSVYLAQQAAHAAVQQYAQQTQQQQAPNVQAQYEIVAAYADRALAEKYPAWGEMKNEVADMIRQRPYLFPDTALQSPAQAADALETVFKLVASDHVPQQGQDQSDLLRTMKMQAQTATGGGGHPDPVAQAQKDWEAVKEAAKTSPGQYWT